MRNVGAVFVSTRKALLADKTPPEICNACTGLDNEIKAKLMTFPAIITKKKSGVYAVTSETDKAFLAYLTGIEANRETIEISYAVIREFPLNIICSNGEAYGVDVSHAVSDFNESQWLVKKVDLREAFEKTGLEYLIPCHGRG